MLDRPRGIDVAVRVLLVSLCLLLLLSDCSRGVACADSDVLKALNKALDGIYAETRTHLDIEVQIRDIISVGRSANRASCKAVLNVAIVFSNNTRREQEAVIEFVAERSDSGNVVTTVTSPL